MVVKIILYHINTESVARRNGVYTYQWYSGKIKMFVSDFLLSMKAASALSEHCIWFDPPFFYLTKGAGWLNE